jgi:nicotinic acetylcholine receptor
MGITSSSVVCSVVVSHLHYKGKMGDHVPELLLKICNFLDRFIKVRRHRSKANPDNSQGSANADCLSDYRTPLQDSFNSASFTFRTEVDYIDLDKSQYRMACKSHRHRSKSQSCERMQCLDEISHKLDHLLERHERSGLDRAAIEWQEIAAIIDRSLFWLFVFITCAITVIILLLVPLGKTVELS